MKRHSFLKKILLSPLAVKVLPCWHFYQRRIVKNITSCKYLLHVELNLFSYIPSAFWLLFFARNRTKTAKARNEQIQKQWLEKNFHNPEPKNQNHWHLAQKRTSSFPPKNNQPSQKYAHWKWTLLQSINCASVIIFGFLHVLFCSVPLPARSQMDFCRPMPQVPVRTFHSVVVYSTYRCLPLNSKQERLVSVKAERPNHPSRLSSRGQPWGGQPVGAQPCGGSSMTMNKKTITW